MKATNNEYEELVLQIGDWGLVEDQYLQVVRFLNKPVVAVVHFTINTDGILNTLSQVKMSESTFRSFLAQCATLMEDK